MNFGPKISLPRWIAALLVGGGILMASGCALFAPSEPAATPTDLPKPTMQPATAAPTASLSVPELTPTGEQPPPTLELPTATPEDTPDAPAETPLLPTGTPVQTLEPRTPTPIPETPTPAVPTLEETWIERSPDGQWEVIGTVSLPTGGAGESYYVRVDVLSLLGEAAWVIGDEWRPLGLGYTTPRILAWSADGTYLYLTERPVPDGCAIYVNGSDLQRLDLATGELVTLVPSSGLWLALAPDETRLAYIGYGGRGLVIRDLTTGTEQEVSLDPGEPYAAGDITWAPDGSAVIVGLGISPCAGDWAGGVALTRVNFPSLVQTELLPADDRLFRILGWEANGILLQDKDGDLWLLDTQTGALVREG